MDSNHVLANYAAELDLVGVPAEARPLLADYLDRIMRENQEINLYSRKIGPDRLVTDHLLDSLLGLPLLPQVSVIADLGSGGGFPAIPLALCRPQTRFVLYEKSPLKCRFLEKTAPPNVSVAGPLPQDGRLPTEIDLVTARAFKPIQVIVTMTKSYFMEGGRYFLFKARRQKINEELQSAKLKPAWVNLEKLEPFGDAEERHLVRFARPTAEKTKKPPKKQQQSQER